MTRGPGDELDGVWPAVAPAVSVIVVHHEQPRELARTLRALALQTHPADRLEVIVVDDGSAVVPRATPGVEVIAAPHRGAPGAARNLGAARARGDVICFLDADTSPEPAYVRELTRLPALRSEAVTVGRRRHADFTRLPADAPPARGREAELPEPEWLRAGYAATRDLRDADERSYRYVISAVLACSRAFLAEVGGFAELTEYGGEDWEWAHRAWRAGAEFAHVPTAVAWHDGPEFAGRADARQRRALANAEALRLARLIGVAGSAGRALRPERAETVIRMPDPGTPAACFVCADSLLIALPAAAVVLPRGARAPCADDRVRPLEEWPAGSLDWPRLELTVHRPLEADPGRLVTDCAQVLDAGLARLVLEDDRGPLLSVVGCRARRRARRDGDRTALAGRRRPAGSVAALDADPDVAAWVGGWANPRLPPA